jgi:signal peptidase I
VTDQIQREPPRRRSAIVEILKTAAQALFLFLVLSALIGRFEVHQISMEPTFHEGQRVLVSKLGSIWSNLLVRTAHAAETPPKSPFALKRGQVVVFYRAPARQDDALIKRVIGLPGETIAVADGQVLINGAPLDEPYIHGISTSCGAVCEPYTLADDEYFVMGDNRTNSLDSRNFGPVHASEIVGRVMLRYWPLSDVEYYR